MFIIYKPKNHLREANTLSFSIMKKIQQNNELCT